jgi:xanthine/CO dehydrogenase XdhC/CoxF family maturation factor
MRIIFGKIRKIYLIFTLHPSLMKELKSILQFYRANTASDLKIALATVVHVEDSSYRRIGARMLILENGQWVGGISGGCLEGDALLQAKKVMLTGKGKVVTYDTRGRDAYQIGVGLGCEGRIDVYLQLVTDELMAVLEACTVIREKKLLVTPIAVNREPVLPFFSTDDTSGPQRSGLVERRGEKALFEWLEPNLRVVILGDNYDVYPMLDLCRTMGWEIILAGRQRKLRREGLEGLAQILPPEELGSISTDQYTAVLCMSHDYAADMKALSHFLVSSVGYLGLLGPRKRFERMIAELGLEREAIDRVHSPMGLHLGAVTPEEIAASAVAEIIRTFRGGDGRPLREREGPIHLATPR